MMKQINPQQSIIKQKGAAVLLVSIVLLIGVTLITIFAARVGVMDQRIAANEYRHKEAQAAAHAALEQGAAFLENNIGLYDADTTNTDYSWKDCSAVAIKDDVPCTIGTTTYSLAYDSISSTTTIDPITYTATLASGILSDSYVVYKSTTDRLTAIGIGESLDGTGSAFSEVSYGKSEFITPGVVPPILASGVGLNGSFTIIADPRVTYDDSIDCKLVKPTDVESIAGTDGYPLGNLSLWVNTSGSSGTWQTCAIDDFVDDSATSEWGGPVKCVYEFSDDPTEDDWGDCSCDSEAHLSDSDNGGTTAGYLPTYEHADIKGEWNVVEDFPPSPFEHFFNGKDVGTVRDEAIAEGIYVDGNCDANSFDGYETKDKPLVWIKGDCNIDDVGSQANPIVIVVEDGKATINSNTNVWGIVVALEDFTVNGGAIVHGALIMEDANTYAFNTAGGYTQVYDFCVISNLQDPSNNTDLAKIKYSAKDFKL